MGKCSFTDEEFLVLRLDDGWFYALARAASEKLKSVLAFSLVVKADEFHPPKYRELVQKLSEVRIAHRGVFLFCMY